MSSEWLREVFIFKNSIFCFYLIVSRGSLALRELEESLLRYMDVPSLSSFPLCRMRLKCIQCAPCF